MASDLGAIFKAYDVRGIVPDQWDADVARAAGTAMAEVLGLAGRSLVVGRDMRPSSPELAAAFADGARAAGANVVDIGLASTDMLYFASGTLAAAGVMFTASHNPAQYNGMKLCRAGAVPISSDTGLADIAARAAEILDAGAPPTADPPGELAQVHMLASYGAYLRSLVDSEDLRPLKVVIDAGNGMAGLTALPVLEPLGITVVPLYFELDGTFPNHEANPLDPANLVDLQAAVREQDADLGLAFDGDADRCFVIDERGEPVSPSAVTALVASRELDRVPGATILYNLICSRAVPETIAAAGGVGVRTRVGHSYIKAEMARTGALFGGEHSAHYYFKDFYNADTGMLAALHVLAVLGHDTRAASALFTEFDPYFSSGELNTAIEGDPAAVIDEIASAYNGEQLDRLDGLTVESPEHRWWFNVRPSNTEPLLRLNAEAASPEQLRDLTENVMALIRRRAT